MTAAETKAEGSVERFGNASQGWLGLFLAGCFACLLAMGIYLRIAGKSPIFPANPIIDVVILCGLVSSLIIPLAIISIQAFIAEIRVDADFLTWKTWRGTSRVPWSEISDFYESDKTAKATVCVVKTMQGDFRFSSLWTRFPLLRMLIAERATNACAKEWATLGSRPELDWPKTFDYNDGLNRWGLSVLRLVCYLFTAWNDVDSGPRVWRGVCEIASYYGWGWGIASIILFLVGSNLILILCFLVVPTFGELRRRQSQKITLSRDGIRYSDSTRTVASRWDEITNLISNGPGPCKVVTRHGSFDFRLTTRRLREHSTCSRLARNGSKCLIRSQTSPSYAS